MSIYDKLKVDLKETMKAADSEKLSTVRMLLSALHNREIEEHARGTDVLDEDRKSDVMRKEAKKRKEAAEIYAKAGREDLEKKELKELKIIQGYLPAELSDTEVEKIAGDVVAAGAKDIGTAMKEAMKIVAGRADAGRVSAIVRKLLS
ncbi:MAG: GatB/YqeY domain-containing protein [Patescibacteria group bacterium]|nr:GatB/YqeY domain-containing protein [Patescibacteria group bacterium]